MGRPKKSDLQCSICNQTFLKKINLKFHMECHEDLEDDRQTSLNSNWCSICKKSFEDSEYKLHIQIMHELIQENTSEQEEDPFPDSGYVLIKKRRARKELNITTPDTLNSERSPKRRLSKLQSENRVDISVDNIKRELTETSDEEEYDKSPKRKPLMSPKKRLSKHQSENRVDISVDNIKTELTETSDEEEYDKSPKRKPFIKCQDCGMRYKGLRGLRLHMSRAHKNSRSYLDNSLADDSDEIQDDQDTVQESDKNNLDPDNGDNPSLDAGNGLVLLNQSSQPGLIYNMLPYNNITSFGNQPDLQVLPPPGTEGAKIIEIIPRFDPESQIYVKWLKKFVQKCKMQKYPLSSITCENINYVTDEIETAMFNPTGSLKTRSSYFYFMKMHKILSEIMSGHMRHCLSVVIK